MNPITKYIARFIERLSVPSCEDCKFWRPENRCLKRWTESPYFLFPVPADMARRDREGCGKHGRYFEPKEKP